MSPTFDVILRSIQIGRQGSKTAIVDVDTNKATEMSETVESAIRRYHRSRLAVAAQLVESACKRKRLSGRDATRRGLLAGQTPIRTATGPSSPVSAGPGREANARGSRLTYRPNRTYLVQRLVRANVYEQQGFKKATTIRPLEVE